MSKVKEFFTNPDILMILALVFVIVGFILWLPIQLLTEYGIAKLGTVGDFIGGTAGPFLNFASLLLFLAALMLQREDLKLTRLELEATRKEFKEQNGTSKLQRFENTLFNMLTLHNNVVESMQETFYFGENGNDTLVLNGRKCFKQLVIKLKEEYKRASTNSIDGEDEVIQLLYLREAYRNFLNDYQHAIGHYFRHLDIILRFIDESGLLLGQKMQYVRILKAQLSSYELVLFFYNALSGQWGNDLRLLLKKYQFFNDDIIKGQLFHETHLELFANFSDIQKRMQEHLKGSH